MVALNPEERRVVETYQALPADRRSMVLTAMLRGQPTGWKRFQDEGEDRLRQLAADRGQNWDDLTDEQRQQLVCDLMDENRR